MKLDKEDLKAIVEVLTAAESFRPIVNAILDTIKSFGPEIEDIPKKLCQWFVKNRIESVKMYEAEGFSREDAITMTLDDVWAFKRMGSEMKRSA